jgi:radical SAM superfamily enzyme YgiQ (UPF0313 family)
VLGGVGAKSVEAEILRRFPWIDVVAHGEGERSVAPLVSALRDGRDLADVPGVFYRRPDGSIACNPQPARIDDLASIGRPAWHRTDLGRYDAYGMVTSRGCPYPCTFCSVAPVWDRVFRFRSAEDVVGEMRELYERAGVELFLFQDEFFVSSKRAVHEFCRVLRASGLPVRWKAFARVDLADETLMAAMADAGCIEIRFGIESGSDRMLRRIRKGFTSAQAVEVVAAATRIVPRVDAFFIWGFPDETMDDFHQSLGVMAAFRLMGARILPSLLCLLPQTELYRSLTPEERGRLEFCDELLPEYMITGHEICCIGTVAMAERHRPIFDFVRRHADLFPGFFLLEPERTVRPKLELLRQHGFYTRAQRELADLRQTDSCGAHSPRI